MTAEIITGVTVGTTILIVTNLITFHIARWKSNKSIKENVHILMAELNIITEAIMNSNGFGEKFKIALKEVRDRKSHELETKDI